MPGNSTSRSIVRLIVAGSLWTACVSPERPARPSSTGSPAKTARATAATKVAPSHLGVVVAREQVPLSFPAPMRLARVAVRVGDSVKAGQVVAEVDATELEAGLAQAKAAHREASAADRQARVGLRQAKLRARQDQRLFADGVIAANEVEESRFAVEQARSAVDRTEATVDQRRAELDKLRQLRQRASLRAPIAGQVSALDFDVGATIPAGAPVVTLLSGERELRFAVPPARTAHLSVGDSVEVSAEGTVWTAEVRSIAPEVDLASQLIFAEASFATGDQATLPAVGTRVRVRLADANANEQR